MKDATFSSARLLEFYDRISDAEDAIPRLRRFVLDLAVRGKLVEQDAGDEPAAELLKRIAQEEARLVETGKIKNRPSLPKVADMDAPFTIPDTWHWTRFGSIADFSAGRTPARNESAFWNTGDHCWVSIADMSDGQTLTKTKETVSEKSRQEIFKSEPEEPGTMIMSFKLTIGKIARLGVPAFHNEAIISIRPHLPALDPLLFKVLPDLARGGDTKGAIKGATLNRESLSNILIPLPPLAEQHRIVAKVDELMALCDQLEQARAGREAVRDRLTTASLARLTAPETDAEAFQSHARFALQSLPTLTSRPDQIKTLRQAILNLAMRGKLVAQDPADEPATELLKRISAAHPKRKSLKEHEFGVPNQLADGWSVAHLDAIASFENGDRSSNYRSGSDIKSEGVPFFSTKNLTDHRLHFSNLDFITDEKFASLRSGKLVDQDILITLRGSVGKFGLFEVTPLISTGFINAQLMIIRCVDRALVPYLLRFMQSGVFSEQITRLSSGSATPQLSAGKLGEAELWLPPLAEQHRIVAKVEALMALCDQLEASLTTAATTRSKLLEALLHEALEPAAEELEAAE